MKRVIKWNGRKLLVKGGVWLDSIDACFYEVVEFAKNFVVCREYATGELFAIVQYSWLEEV